MLIETLSDGRQVVIVRDCFVLDGVAFCKAAVHKYPELTKELRSLIRRNLEENDKTEAWDVLVESTDTRVRLGVAGCGMFLRTLSTDLDTTVRDLAVLSMRNLVQYKSSVYGTTELG